MKTHLVFLLVVAVFWVSCSDTEDGAIAYGNFEAHEVYVSARNNGQLFGFDIEKGSKLKAGQLVGWIDTTMLALQKEQHRARQKSLDSKIAEVRAGLKVLDSRLENIKKNKARVENLLASGAATQQEADNLTTEMQVIENQIAQTKQSIRSIRAEQDVLAQQIRMVEKQLADCRIVNPIDGTVLEKYFENTEMCMAGKPLYKIASLDELELKAYIDEPGLAQLHTGLEVQVAIDGPADSLLFYPGTVTWIASESEFTPKIIQTRNERVNQVYAFKVNVRNDGKLKIGLPAEVHLK